MMKNLQVECTNQSISNTTPLHYCFNYTEATDCGIISYRVDYPIAIAGPSLATHGLVILGKLIGAQYQEILRKSFIK